ncbi:MAG: hypothetical protein IKS96_09385 [Fibrobacter sp.]|nr:hypothetical protein [Fibrobacter sp.]
MLQKFSVIFVLLTTLTSFTLCSCASQNVQTSSKKYSSKYDKSDNTKRNAKTKDASTEISKKTFADTPRNRTLYLGEQEISESDFGGVERWYASNQGLASFLGSYESKVVFQVGFFKDTKDGFILYEDGTTGEFADFSRQGLDLRWDWGVYSIIIKPDGSGLYYDFSTSVNGLATPRDQYKMHKF